MFDESTKIGAQTAVGSNEAVGARVRRSDISDSCSRRSDAGSARRGGRHGDGTAQGFDDERLLTDGGEATADGFESVSATERRDPVAINTLASLRSVSYGALLSLVGLIAMKVFEFGMNLALTRALSVDAYGVYAYGAMALAMLVGFVHLGANPTLIRYIPAYRDDPVRQQWVFGLAVLTTGVSSLCFAFVTYQYAPTINAVTLDEPMFVPVLRLFALMLPLVLFAHLFADLFRSLERIEYQVLIVRLAEPGGYFLAAVLALVVGLTLLETVGAMLVAMGLTLCLALWLVVRKTSIRPVVSRQMQRGDVFEFYNTAVPMALSRFGNLMHNRVDVLLVGLLLSASAAGIYNIALFLTALISIPLSAVNVIFPPVASRLYTDGDNRTLNAVYSTATRWIVTGALVLAAVQYVYRYELLSLFGSAYTTGASLMTLFIVARLVHCGVGSAGWLLVMTGHQYAESINSWLVGVLNVVLSYYFILEFGLIGAALGTASALAAINVLRVVEIWHFERLSPFEIGFLKPIAACLAMVAVLYGVGFVLSGTVLLLVGTVVGVGTFAGVLLLAGIEPADRELLAAFAQQYREWKVARES